MAIISHYLQHDQSPCLRRFPLRLASDILKQTKSVVRSLTFFPSYELNPIWRVGSWFTRANKANVSCNKKIHEKNSKRCKLKPSGRQFCFRPAAHRDRARWQSEQTWATEKRRGKNAIKPRELGKKGARTRQQEEEGDATAPANSAKLGPTLLANAHTWRNLIKQNKLFFLRTPNAGTRPCRAKQAFRSSRTRKTFSCAPKRQAQRQIRTCHTTKINLSLFPRSYSPYNPRAASMRSNDAMRARGTSSPETNNNISFFLLLKSRFLPLRSRSMSDNTPDTVFSNTFVPCITSVPKTLTPKSQIDCTPCWNKTNQTFLLLFCCYTWLLFSRAYLRA